MSTKMYSSKIIYLSLYLSIYLTVYLCILCVNAHFYTTTSTLNLQITHSYVQKRIHACVAQAPHSAKTSLGSYSLFLLGLGLGLGLVLVLVEGTVLS